MFLLYAACVAGGAGTQMPLPWTRTLELQQPPMNGSDVTIMLGLVARTGIVVRDKLPPSTSFSLKLENTDGVHRAP